MRREEKQEDELCDARSLLAKVYLDIKFDAEDTQRLADHMEEHLKHRIEDYEEQMLEPIPHL